MRPSLLIVAACALLAREAEAQSLAERVRNAKDDNVVFHFTPRAGVCGDGRSFVRMGHSYQGSFNSGDYSRPCEPGPVQVQLTLRAGEVEGVQAWVGRLRAHDAQDLGTVPAPEAARYLLSLPRAASPPQVRRRSSPPCSPTARPCAGAADDCQDRDDARARRAMTPPSGSRASLPAPSTVAPTSRSTTTRVPTRRTTSRRTRCSCCRSCRTARAYRTCSTSHAPRPTFVSGARRSSGLARAETLARSSCSSRC